MLVVAVIIMFTTRARAAVMLIDRMAAAIGEEVVDGALLCGRCTFELHWRLGLVVVVVVAFGIGGKF